MGNHMNRYGVLSLIRCVEDAPVTDPALAQTRTGVCERLWMDLIVMLGEPLDLCGDTPGDWGIKTFAAVGITLGLLRHPNDWSWHACGIGGPR
jgi:hypothetical protein